MKNSSISIVIPCYNRYDVLTNCLGRLEQQTCKDFEVIIVDDCSTNQLYADLMDYKKSSDLELVIIKNEKNLGPGVSRNLGVKETKGKYIMFIDSDDYIEKEAVEQIRNVIDKYAPDCIYFDFNRICEDNMVCYKVIQSNKDFINMKEALNYANYSTWCKVFNADIIKNNNIIFPDFLRGEDYVFTKLALAECEKIYYIRKPLYNYIDQKRSLIKTNDFGKYAKEQYKFIKKHWKHEELKDEVKCIYIYLLFFSRIWYIVEHKYTNDEIRKEIKTYKCDYVDWIQNEYIMHLPIYQQVFLKYVNKEQIAPLKMIVKLRKLIKDSK